MQRKKLTRWLDSAGSNLFVLGILVIADSSRLPQHTQSTNNIVLFGAGLCILGVIANRLGEHIGENKQYSNRVCIRAQITGISRSDIEVDGVAPWIINCEYTDPKTDQKYTFQSDTMTEEPNADIVGAYLDVYVNPDNMYEYSVDLDLIVKNGKKIKLKK